jgi:hypothetical protein
MMQEFSDSEAGPVDIAVATAVPSAPDSKDEWEFLEATQDVQCTRQHPWQKYMQCAKTFIKKQPPNVLLAAVSAATAVTVLSIVVQQPCMMLCFVTLNFNSRDRKHQN